MKNIVKFIILQGLEIEKSEVDLEMQCSQVGGGRRPLQGKASSTFFLAATPPSLALNSPPLDFS